MLVIGVAGPTGSGKSTVCRLLSRRPGVEHVDCDELAHASYRPGSPAYQKLVARFGEEILLPTGEIDRRKLGEIVFSDPKAKADLEAIVHPEVAAAIKEAISEAKKRPLDWLLVEGALLLSSPHVDRGIFDAFVWLSAPEKVRYERLLRAGLSRQQARQRLQAQRGLAPPQGGQVYRIDASPPPEVVAERVWQLLKRLAEEPSQRDKQGH